jgi:uncharacterized membrane protein
MFPRLLCLTCSLLFCASFQITQSLAQQSATSPKQQPAEVPKPAQAPASPQSTHYPILLLGHGSDPVWSVLIGQKGPERFDRANYPPIALEPANVSPEAPESWVYRAKDIATGADVTIHLTREVCIDSASEAIPETPPKTTPPGKPATSATPPLTIAKNAFRIVLEHGQIGTFHGCARVAAELFPKIINQSADDDDAEKKKPPVNAITNFKAPTAVAYVTSTGKIIVSRGAAKKVIPVAGAELALSHDGKKLLYTRNDSKMGSEHTLVLYDFDTARSTDLVHGAVREAFWAPDDSRFAYLQSQDQKWRVVSSLINTPETPTPLYNGNVDSLQGWADVHTVLADDAQSLYWVSDDRPQQSVPLKEIYGDTFRVSDTDTIRTNPVNPDLLLVSAKYFTAPAGAPPDAAGIFLYEIRAKRRVVLTAPEQWSSHGEWSRDGIQIFYTRRMSATSSVTYRIFWDGSGPRRYLDGTDLVVGQ